MKSSELKGYITGLILGDAYIDKGVRKRAFRMKSINTDFAEKVLADLTAYFDMSIKYHEGSVRGGVNRKPYAEVYSKAHPYFAKKYPYFYDDYRNRRITKESLNALTPAGIANWYMSDGYIVHVGKQSGNVKYRRVELATDRYSKRDVEKAARYFEDVYGFKMSLVKRKTNVYRLRFSMESAQRLFVMIHPHVVPSMLYKINLNVPYRPKWMSDEYFDLMNEITEREAPHNCG